MNMITTKLNIKKITNNLLVFFLYFLISGCAVINFIPNPGFYIQDEKIDIGVGLLLNASQIMHSYKMGPFTRINTGFAFRLASENAFKKIFTKVEIVKSEEEFENKELTLLIIPSILKFNVSPWTHSAELLLRCRILDRKGKVIYDVNVIRKGQKVGGALSQALSQNSKDAFEKAFIYLAYDIMKKVDFSVYMKK